jgi:hypothetical protein
MFGVARVHWLRIGQGRQSRRENAKVTRPRLSGFIDRLVALAGQVAVPASAVALSHRAISTPQIFRDEAEDGRQDNHQSSNAAGNRAALSRSYRPS